MCIVLQKKSVVILFKYKCKLCKLWVFLVHGVIILKNYFTIQLDDLKIFKQETTMAV